MGVFGTSAKYLQALQDLGYQNSDLELKQLRMILSTGSPLSKESFRYVYGSIKKASLLLGSMSGGTDIISLFVGMNPMLPVYAGEVQCKCLGMAVEAMLDGEEGKKEAESKEKQSEAGDRKNSIEANEAFQTGELVCTKAFPSMPIYFWNDPDGSKYRKSYFSERDGVWFHGDFIQVNRATGGIVMLGRSDGTLNPGGVRFGSAEIYNLMVQFAHSIDDTLVVGQQRQGEIDERVLMFVKMKEGCQLTESLVGELKHVIRTELSPRHVPQCIVACPDIPYTINGKKVELAVKKIVCGKPSVHNASSLSNPECLVWFNQWTELTEKEHKNA